MIERWYNLSRFFPLHYLKVGGSMAAEQHNPALSAVLDEDANGATDAAGQQESAQYYGGWWAASTPYQPLAVTIMVSASPLQPLAAFAAPFHVPNSIDMAQQQQQCHGCPCCARMHLHQ
jgi:hypothetical protein